MNSKKAPAPGGQDRRAGRSTNHCNSNTGFPICKLYNRTIAHRFPNGCPFAAENPLTALAELIDRSWSNLYPDDPYLADSLHQQSCCDVCQSCVGNYLTHPTVQRLRRAVQAIVEPADTGNARNGQQHGRPARSPVYV